ncbi:MAG: hypothetical protein H6832_12445 [Planctomycetes bacterium]|nr:hypothetical protein [Planctomycetota bacterium]MCB9919202.1 hypothetical protein [Planctomycetota bacterium]
MSTTLSPTCGSVPKKRARALLLVLFLFALFALPSCKFLMDEFFVLEQAPPSLDDVMREAAVR